MRARQSNIICHVNIWSDKFTWTNKIGVAEISDLGEKWNVGRIYNDACDVGFKVVSKRTGQDAIFYLSEERRSGEGDIYLWIFKPIPEDVRQGRVAADIEIHILND